MPFHEIPALKSWLAAYIAGFASNGEEQERVFRLKRVHTKRVCITIRRLGRALRLPESDLQLAEAAALLHDIGRFSQYARYGTFRDRDSANHGRLGLRVINRHGLLAGVAPAERRHLARAVAFHNAARLPPLADKRSLFFLKLLRDADKLDIWRVVIGHHLQRGRMPKVVNEFDFAGNGHCSPAVLSAIARGRVVPIEAVRSVCDATLLYISWVYDMNFAPSLRETLRGGYLERLAATAPPSAEIQNTIQSAREHARRRSVVPETVEAPGV
ncbi:MAG: HD domain-containing protein [Desulfobacterales bacterium]|jgi:hypothetical protein|nr:HD domain-containing protein [Desulfobacterales bacterium]